MSPAGKVGSIGEPLVEGSASEGVFPEDEEGIASAAGALKDDPSSETWSDEPRRSRVYTIAVEPRRGQKLHHPGDNHYVPSEEKKSGGK